MRAKWVLGAAFAVVFSVSVAARADVLAAYPFTGSSLDSTDLSTVSTASAITLGSGLTDTTRFALGNGNPAPALRVNSDETTGTSFLTAIAAGDDFQFSITPNTGDFLTLDTLTFDLALDSAAFTSNVEVQLSGTGTVGSYTTLETVAGFSTTTFTTETASLTPANTALAAGLPIYVRFVVFDNASNAAAYTGFDNITVTGTATALVPEPGPNALLAIGTLVLAGGIFLRRRRANAS